MSTNRNESNNHCMLKILSSDRSSIPSTPRPEIATRSSSSQQLQHQRGSIKTASQDSTINSDSQIASSTEEVSSYKATTMKDFLWIAPIFDELALCAADEEEDHDSSNGGGDATFPLAEELYILSLARWSSNESPLSKPASPRQCFEHTPSSLPPSVHTKQAMMAATPSSTLRLSKRLGNSLMQEMGLKQAARKNHHKSQEEMIMNELTRSDSFDRIYGGKRRKVKTLRSRRNNPPKQQQYFAPAETSPDNLIKIVYEDE